ncbi:MAG TPA: hypothetical protein DHV63_05155 [Pseudomonas sp.]|uniref:Uncharacterized protein n=1 Tax=Brevundimonas diminuta 3F5N TaxID=1255603 RepID=A0A1R4FFT6_BREDI|nr:hypothetical protein [Brevundimonas diminuta]SJM54758.1 hypothetical protein FM111_04520 [Brevundimonas diminuta 3F5N]HCJ28674.1 hypothetical protein [Pseudomonas sp.]
MTVLTEAEWEERFVPLIRQDEDCLLFDAYNADERAFLEAVGNNRIWTQVEADDAIEYVPGRWKINATGYIVTMNPWADDEGDLAVVIELDMDCERDGEGVLGTIEDGGSHE